MFFDVINREQYFQINHLVNRLRGTTFINFNADCTKDRVALVN